MELHRLLSIEDLIKFCDERGFTQFSAKDSGYQVCVQIPAVFEKEEYEDDTVMYGNVKLMHTNNNRNGSALTEEAAKKCMKTLAYKPILANFAEVDGELDFTSHDFEFDDEGNVTYYEKQVGCFTADKPELKADGEHEDRKYIFAKCAIPRQYTAAADIIERKGGTKLSAELGINKMSYDSKEKVLLLEDVVVLGAALLGKDPETGKEVQEGMEGARLDIADFSFENNSCISKSELIDEITQAIIERLDDHIANTFANDNQRKEDNGLENQFEEKIEEEVIEVAEETMDEVTPEVVEDFDGEDGNAGGSDNGTTAADPAADPAANPAVNPVANPVANPAADDDSKEEESDEDDEDDGDDLNNGQNGKKVYSINGVNFEVSLSEIQYSLYELVNNTYSESDNDYYCVEVYEGSKTVVMSGLFTGRSYRQSYKVRNGVYSLTGDRVSVKAVYVTADEEAELDRMRSNYAAISEKLGKYESEPEKMNILNSADYANIMNLSDFKELKKQENHFDMTVDELKNKADAMLLQYAKSGKLTFAANEQKEEVKKNTNTFFAFAARKRDTSFLDSLLKK